MVCFSLLMTSFQSVFRSIFVFPSCVALREIFAFLLMLFFVLVRFHFVLDVGVGDCSPGMLHGKLVHDFVHRLDFAVKSLVWS